MKFLMTIIGDTIIKHRLIEATNLNEAVKIVEKYYPNEMFHVEISFTYAFLSGENFFIRVEFLDDIEMLA